jgi:hypothetical protein
MLNLTEKLGWIAGCLFSVAGSFFSRGRAMRNRLGNCYLFALILFPCLVFQMGCAGKTHATFENKIKKMSDTELVGYYHGIEEKIRTVDAKMHTDGRSVGESKNQDSNLNLIPSPFWMGGDGYDLLQQRKGVLKELEKRNITP